MTAASCAMYVQTMFGGPAGSEAQRNATQWASAFQDSPDAWRVCVEVLTRPVDLSSPQAQTLLLFVAQVCRWRRPC